MGMNIDITYACDGCNIRIEEHRNLTTHSPEDIAEDVWIPDYWLWTENMLFHDDQCYRGWLRRTGRLQELVDFDNAIPMA